MTPQERNRKSYLKNIQDPIKLAKRRKNAIEWYYQHKDDLRVKQRSKEYRKLYYEKIKHSKSYKQHSKQYSKNYTQTRKTIVIWHYSGGFMDCNCCGVKDNRFLTIDHLENNGGKLRYLHGTGTKFYNWLIKNNLPINFQVLCWNCNSAKGLNQGICPHKEILSK